jgi:eukaryotic-like serine/threonine-protein kinase
MAHPDAAVYPGQVLAGRWEIGPWIGDGNFSLVYEARDRLTQAQCAVKVLSMTRRSSEALDEFRSESDLLRMLSSCSNVIAILDSGSHPMTATVGAATFSVDVEYIVLERAAVDLAELLVRRHSIEWEERLGLFRDVAKGMHQMHLREIANRDLKGDNVLVFDAGKTAVAKVADLGRSKDTKRGPRFLPEDYTSGRGDLRFAAPELLWGLGNTDADTMRLADLYLLGSIFFELASAQGLTGVALGNPHAIMMSTVGMTRNDREADFSAHISDLQTRYELVYSVFELEVPKAVRAQACRLLRQLSSVDPCAREPVAKQRGGLPVRWDLQWLLRQIDIMILTLRTERRRDAKRPWKTPKV